MARAVYPGTFDPLTRGHEDLIRRAARLFDSVVLGVAASRGKNPLFEPDERIAMARAFLKDAPILLLDEATSALDRESEQAVLQGLADLMKGRTVLLISHAPERLIHVDRTVALG